MELNKPPSSLDRQVTNPAEVREKLDICEGDVLIFDLDGGGAQVTKLQPFDEEWHRALAATLADEWNSPEDDEAFAVLLRA